MQPTSYLPAHHAPLYYYGFDEHLIEVLVHEGASRLEALPEAFVQDLWASQTFDHRALRTTHGEPVEVIDTGRLNHDGGPDFLNATVRIGGQSWRGDVEIHVTSRGWNAHRHQSDARYDAVVLHVALQADLATGSLRRPDGTVLPEVILAPLLTTPLRRLLYQFLTETTPAVPCAAGWPTVPKSRIAEVIARQAHTRFAQRGRAFEGQVRAEAQHAGTALDAAWEQVLMVHLFGALGAAQNATPMRLLADRITLDDLRALGDPLDREALLFGLAGLLPTPGALVDTDRHTADYAIDLGARFRALQHRVPRMPMRARQWQTGRVRPANAPGLRLAQIAGWFAPGALLADSPLRAVANVWWAGSTAPQRWTLLSGLLEAPAGLFWHEHIRLDRRCKPISPRVGVRRREQIGINALVPAMLAAHALGLPDANAWTTDAVLDLARIIPAERDRVVKPFRALGVRPKSAWETQGLHQLRRTRCDHGRCLTCPIGQHLIGRASDFRADAVAEPDAAAA